MLRGCHGSIISLFGKRKHAPLQQSPGIPPEKADLSLSTEISSVVEVAAVLLSLIVIPGKHIAGLTLVGEKSVLTASPSRSPLEQVPELLGAEGSVSHCEHLEKPCSDKGICAFPSRSWIN